MKNLMFVISLVFGMVSYAQYNTEAWETYSYQDSSETFEGIYSEGTYNNGKIKEDMIVYSLIIGEQFMIEMYLDGYLGKDISRGHEYNYLIVEQDGEKKQIFTCYISEGVIVLKKGGLLIDIINKGKGDVLHVSVDNSYIDTNSKEKWMFNLKTKT